MSKFEDVVCVINDKEYFYCSENFYSARFEDKFKSIANTALQDSRLRSSRTNPEEVEVAVYKQNLVKGKVERKFHYKYSLLPYPEDHTEESYNAELNSELSDIPSEFHQFIKDHSWDEGHSAGYHEVLNVASTLVYALKPAIESFRKRIENKK